MSDVLKGARRKIDALDQKIQDALIERAELVLKIGEEKRKNDLPVVQPDREAVLMRNLIDRHRGDLPKEGIIRIWRELIGAVSLLQTDLKVVVTVPEDHTGLIYWDLAKDYFSSVLPMQKIAKPLGALAMVREDDAQFAVMPWPADGEKEAWWTYLTDETGDKPMRVTGRVPFGDRSQDDVNPEHKGLIVSRWAYKPSGADRSFIALLLRQDISRARLVEKAGALKMEALSLHSAPFRDGVSTIHLLEVDDYVAEEDPRLSTLLESLDSVEAQIMVIGGYPVPPVYEDKVGKNAKS